MDKAFLTETINPSRKPVLTERKEEDGQKFFYLKGLFLEGEVQNHNGRVYPRTEIENAVKNLNERIAENGPIAGELDHPEGLNINFDRIAVAITEMHVDGNNGHGSMRVIPAGLGLILEGAIKAGIQVGVSSRGSGNVGGDGKVSDFDIVTVDAVINPSAPNARPAASIAESLAQNKHGREALRLTEYVHDDPVAQKFLEKEITEFLMSIRDEVVWRK
jgi:hypothetical protein